MRAEQGTMLTLGAAVVLPLVLFAALSAAFSLQDQRRQIEAEALSRASAATARIDGELAAEKSALEVLALSRAQRNHEWDAVRAQAERLMANRPRWRNLTLTDLRTGEVLFQTAPGPYVPPAVPAGVPAFSLGGMQGGPPRCPCLVVHSAVREGGAPAYLFTLELDPRDFQQILLSATAKGEVATIVDPAGRFIARTLDFENKVGQLSTPFVRNAMQKSRSGVYEGRTWEGFENYTAFQTSPTTGVSTHIAVGAEQLNLPRRRYLALLGFAGLTALALAAAIGGYGLRQRALRRREEEGRRQAQKLEALGQIAGGVAHDFNNLLAVIIGNLDRLSKQKGPERAVDNALAAAQRGRKLTEQLLAFTRVEDAGTERVDLEHLMDGLKDLIDQAVGAKVQVHMSVAPDARFVHSHGDELGLALLNLAVNARDAMPDGGSIDITTRRSGPAVAIAVRDSGQGMPRHILDKAFEPFFTTKPSGKGTGLGLAQVKRLAVRSRGTVDIASEQGAGCTVTLTLPAA